MRHDWGETLTELSRRELSDAVNEWAKAHHTQFRSQTYGEPAVSLSSNALVDLPEGEGPQWREFSFTRLAPLQATFMTASDLGRDVDLAALACLRATPLDMKAEADRFFLQGVNQFIGHGWPYSPPGVAEPGWRFYAAGVFNVTTPGGR